MKTIRVCEKEQKEKEIKSGDCDESTLQFAAVFSLPTMFNR
jgi:hypothetical protein